MVVLDIRNNRMKDFYDIWFMANTWEFEMESLQKAIEFSFKRRGTSVPEDIPFALTDGFLDDPQKKMQWNAFVNRLDAGEERPTLARTRCGSAQFSFAVHFKRIRHALESNTPLVLSGAKRPSVLFQISISELPTMVDLRIDPLQVWHLVESARIANYHVHDVLQPKMMGEVRCGL